jgi:hypothetical protein
LRSNNYIYLDKDDDSIEFKTDATFIVREGLTGIEGEISFESVDNPEFYIKHWGGYALIEEDDRLGTTFPHMLLLYRLYC